MSARNKRVALKRRVAYHEAGHAVAAAMLRWHFMYVTIRPKGTLKGHMAWPIAKRKRPMQPLVQAVIAFAGPIAEARHTRRRLTTLIRGPDKDHIFAAELTHAMRLRAMETALHMVAYFWREIRCIARALQREQTLKEIAVVKLLALSLRDSIALPS